MLAAQDQWVAHVNDVASGTLMLEGGSWYLGANIPGKPRVFMPYAAGVGRIGKSANAWLRAATKGSRSAREYAVVVCASNFMTLTLFGG